MATKSPADAAKSIASALAFASYLISNLSESELNELKQILWIAKTNSVFIEISKDNDFKKKVTAVGRRYIHLIDFEAGQFSGTQNCIVLYSKFCPAKTGVAKTIISWDIVKPESKRVLLNKRLFGYVHHGISYPGLITRYSAEKLGKGCISVSSQYAGIFISLFRSMKIQIAVKEVAELGR